MWLSAQKIISFCNFPAQEFECMVCCPIGNVTSCALCIGYHLNIINIIVETNYEAYYKMKLQNEWGTFIDLKVLPVSYIFYDVLPNIWVTLFGGMAEYMQSVVKYGIYVILKKHGIRFLSIDRWPETLTRDPTTIRSRWGQNGATVREFFLFKSPSLVKK